MDKNLEIEYKTLLSYGDYEKLLPLFSHVTPVRQTNYYFDTEDLALRQARLSLRIRAFDDSAEMTVKVPQEVGNLEHNVALTLEEANAMIGLKKLTTQCINVQAIVDLLEAHGIDVSKITLQGSLTTTRREHDTEIGKMALDANEYLGKTDYELELEVADGKKGKRDFHQFLADQGIESRFTKSKVVRFLTAAGKY
jgi:uncharacterized protein YjbK